MFNLSMIKQNSKKKRNIINITSLIDVLFLVLTFLLLSTTFLKKNNALKVSLPQVEGKSLSQEQESVEILITSNRKIYVNEKSISIKKLKQQILFLIPKNKRRTSSIQFKVDKRVPYGFAVLVMAEIRSAGIKNLSAITETKPL